MAACLGLLLLCRPASAQLLPPPDYDYDDAAAAPAYTGNSQALVDSWYRRFLGRPADYGAAGWINAINQGQAPALTLATILSSREYYLRGGGTPPGFITALYQDLTGSPPLPEQMHYWLGQMRFLSRRDVAYHLLLFYHNGSLPPQPTPYYSYRPGGGYPHYSSYP
jgi:hypothetical protein